MLAGKFYVTDHSPNAMCSCHKYSLLFAPVQTVVYLEVDTAQIGLNTCITFKNKIVTKSNKLLLIVILRHNICKVERNTLEIC